MNLSNKTKGVLAALFALFILITGTLLYENGIIDKETYHEILAVAGVAEEETPSLEVHFIDVDQAECILIKAPEKTVLIDSGDVGYGKPIENYLRTCGVETIDLFIATHPHADHIGSASSIIKAFPIAKIIMPEVPEEYLPTTTLFENFIKSISASDAKFAYAKAGMVFELGDGATLEILAPISYNGDNLNNYSVVSKLTFGETSFLFTGDAEKDVEGEIINSGADLSCTVFNAGHHGSRTSNSAAFLKAANAKYGAISCGKDNDYGHPHSATLTSFKEFNIEYFRTDYDGSIVFITDGEKLTVSTEK